MNSVVGASRGPWFVSRDAEDFPARLRSVKPLPAGLWVDGRLPRAPEAEALIAIVGARAATRAGCAAVARLAGSLAARGYGVVSGGALGVDAAAHEGALEAGVATFAVLGCGIDVVYPDRHRRLFRAIASSGGLLSEHGAGVPPRAWQFPVRNRLVAALADAVVVADCRPGSGALITAKIARQLGRPLLALPGSPGADALVASGLALPVESGADVSAALAGTLVRGAVGLAKAAPETERFLRVCAALEGRPATGGEVALKLQVPVAEVLAVLCEAELAGWVRRLPGARFEVCRGN